MKTEKIIQGQNIVSQLYEQFKFHLIHQNKVKQSKNIVTDALKDILSQVKRQCKIKRQTKKVLQQNIQNLNKLELTRRCTTVQSRLWRPPIIDENNLQAVKQEIIVVQNQGANLGGQIIKLQEGIGTLKSKIKSLKADLKQQYQKQQKYKHIEYLSRNIQRSTQNSKLSNARSYKKLLKYQDQIITNLKKFKCSLKKQNETIQSKFVQFQQRKYNKMLQSKINYNIPKNIIDMEQSTIKIDSNLISKLQELLNLFMQKQDKYEDIKSQISTKIRFKKINKIYLKDQRIQFHQMIQKFQNTYDIKIQSLPNLIVYFFNQLKSSNYQNQNQCIKRTQIRQSLIQDLQELTSRKYYIQEDHNQPTEPSSLELNHKKQIHKYSAILLHTINLIHNLLGKFKYLFTMSLSLSIQKKNFQALLVQINNIYSNNNIFKQQKSQNDEPDYNITNYHQIQLLLDTLKDKLPINKDEILTLMFSDLRYNLIFRFNWLQQQLKSCKDENELLDKIFHIQSKCQQIYKQKLKNYFTILQKCFKSLTMNKYQKKMILTSNAKQQLFLQLFKDIKLINILQGDVHQIDQQKQNYNTINKFNTQQNQQCIINQDIFSKDQPTNIIKMLEKVRNKNKEIFRPLNVQITKNYIANTKIIIPKIK